MTQASKGDSRKKSELLHILNHSTKMCSASPNSNCVIFELRYNKTRYDLD